MQNIFKSLTLLSLLFFSLSAADAAVKKIAVFDFEDTTVAAQAQKGKEGDKSDRNKTEKGKIGRAVADMIITELVKDAGFKVIERSQLEKILSEQQLSMAGLVDAAQAANIGKLLGVSAVVVGSVTQYGLSTSNIGILGIGQKKSIANVAATARIVDTTTAEIIAAVEGKGSETATGFRMGDYADVDDTGLSDTILGNSMRKAVMDIVKQIREQSAKVRESSFSGSIAFLDKDKKTFIIDLGQDNGIKENMKVYVIKVTREVKSPTTGQVIRRIVESIAELKITGCDRNSSDAVCVDGRCDDIKEGDHVSSVK